MSRPRSLRRDLALGLGGGVVVLWLLAMVGSWVVLRGEVNEIYDAVLKQAAERILQLPSLPSLPTAEATPRAASQRNEDMSFMLRKPDGAILMQSAGADPAVFGGAPRQGFREQGDHRIFGLIAADDTLWPAPRKVVLPEVGFRAV